jgi:hypothetical protein
MPRAILALAARQYGVATTAQLLDAGVGRRAIARRVERGWLVPLYRGVYQAGPMRGRYAREMAAVLACGERVVLSHDSAAAIWGFRPPHEGEVHVTIEGQARRSRQGIRVHRTLSLNAAVHNGLPLTTPARTLKDLARTLAPNELDRAQEQAHILGLVIPDGDRFPEFTRSEGERRLKALCRAAGLLLPHMNARVAGWEVDAFWPAQRLVESDRRKDAALLVAGYRVVRITWRRLRFESYQARVNRRPSTGETASSMASASARACSASSLASRSGVSSPAFSSSIRWSHSAPSACSPAFTSIRLV